VAWWKAKNRILVSIPYYIKSDGLYDNGNTFFIYDTLRGAWTIHRSYGPTLGDVSITDMISFQNAILYATDYPAGIAESLTIRSKEGASDFQDINDGSVNKNSYDYEILTDPIPFPKTAHYEATQIEPIIESDLYGQTNYNFVADFGKQTSGDQKTDAITTAVAKPSANVGMQNITYVQVKLSGTTVTTKTVGLDLYSFNVWYNSGEIASR
jgi:hypothetical protein